LSRTSTPYAGFNRLKKALYTREFAETVLASQPNPPVQPPAHALIGHLFAKQPGQPHLNQMLYVDTKTWLPDDLLVKADKMTMATSVELRVPLLDFQVLEYAASLPQDFKVRGWSTKRVLKEALKDSVPEEILKRKKTGFPVPYEKWLRTELKDYVNDTLLSATSSLGVFFHKNAVSDLIHSHQNGAAGSAEVFCLLIIELWHQRFARSGSWN
jgi:asparagine synthase (glutamine-hydrolysing)